jgi:hypothetical protein
MYQEYFDRMGMCNKELYVWNLEKLSKSISRIHLKDLKKERNWN